ncbi:arylesterase [Telmatobacter bradus]|uniref:arylesterase n=1 Tax=Telmatobacter bradus TaxID=474953 RepID=UPI003B430867
MYALRWTFVAYFLLATGIFLHAAEPRLLVCYGDSITAGYGLEPGQAWPEALSRTLTTQGRHIKVLNRGTSGATTKDALAGLPGLLALHPTAVVVEFGGNDGLRGLPLEATRANLDQLLTGLERAHIRVLLAGITLPPNYGPQYIHSFEKIFRDLAAQHHTVFVPMLYKDLIGKPGSIQPDGIHPTASGSELIAHTLLPSVKTLLRD